MNDPCDEILGNHSKVLRQRFYTLWANRGQQISDRNCRTVIYRRNICPFLICQVGGGGIRKGFLTRNG